jgi:hypothetical protein
MAANACPWNHHDYGKTFLKQDENKDQGGWHEGFGDS